jgi:hypothetical protein
MNKFFTVAVILFIGLLSTNLSYSQGIYLLPDPTNVNEPARLYINTGSSDCQCDELQDAGPENPIYIWTWMPSNDRPSVLVAGESFDVSNGEWEDSNENLRMTQDENNPALWYYDFFNVPLSEFYGASSADFYTTGILFLIKEKSGAAIGGEGPEQKSADLSIVPESPGCVLLFCTFPTIWWPSEYLSITYDNNQEGLFSLQNLDPSEAFIFYEYRVDGGPLQTYGNSDAEAIQLENLGGGFFRHTFIPNDFLPIDIEGGEISELTAVITKSVPVIQAPPFSKQLLSIGCPE